MQNMCLQKMSSIKEEQEGVWTLDPPTVTEVSLEYIPERSINGRQRLIQITQTGLHRIFPDVPPMCEKSMENLWRLPRYARCPELQVQVVTEPILIILGISDEFIKLVQLHLQANSVTAKTVCLHKFSHSCRHPTCWMLSLWMLNFRYGLVFADCSPSSWNTPCSLNDATIVFIIHVSSFYFQCLFRAYLPFSMVILSNAVVWEAMTVLRL